MVAAGKPSGAPGKEGTSTAPVVATWKVTLSCALLRGKKTILEMLSTSGLCKSSSTREVSTASACKISTILNLINQTRAEHHAMSHSDPLVRARLKLLSEPPRLEDLENGVRREINQIFETVLNTSSLEEGG
jgi:hypothetical protein